MAKIQQTGEGAPAAPAEQTASLNEILAFAGSPPTEIVQQLLTVLAAPPRRAGRAAQGIFFPARSLHLMRAGLTTVHRELRQRDARG